MPRLPIVELERGRYFVAYGAPDAGARAEGRGWVAASWLFFLEPLDGGRTRLISRYRAATSDDLATKLAFGEATIEPIGFVMDRRMLRGVKERPERREREVLATTA